MRSTKKGSADGERLDTDAADDDEELDLVAIEKQHMSKKNAQNEQDNKQAFGVSHNLFDVSSYAEVNFNNLASPNQ